MSAGPCQPCLFKVACEVGEDETAFVVGCVPQLGSWCLDGAVELYPEEVDPHGSGVDGVVNSGNNDQTTNTSHQRMKHSNRAGVVRRMIFSATVELPDDKDVLYRYCVCAVLLVGGERKLQVRRWETDLAPRRIPSAALKEQSRRCEIESFGHMTMERHEDSGWLNAESVVQLKLWNNPVQLWSQRQMKYRVKVTPLNMTKTMSEPLVSGEESQELDLQQVRQDVSKPAVQISVLKDGETSFTQQERFGREYETDDFFTFQCQLAQLDAIGYMVDFYTASTPSEDSPALLGSSFILPSQLTETIGTLTLPIISDSRQPVGQLSVEYLVVRPMADVKWCMDASYAHHWSPTWRGLDVGHRGSGNSFSHKPEVCANIRENTIASMRLAGQHGADMVEFDVQLSKDLTPLIYHDFHIDISPRRKGEVDEHDSLTVPLKDLTYSQLMQLQTKHTEETSMGSAHMENDSLDDHQPYPTLAQAMTTLDPHIGFNIEIKWNVQLKDGSYELDHPFELNMFLDHILKVVLQHGGSRRILFSCFNPDVCTMLRLKQGRYPVLFLSQGETDRWAPYMDIRTRSLHMALLYARSAHILGVSLYSDILLQNLDIIRQAKDQDLVVFSWGEETPATIQQLKSHGCDGVIYDRFYKYCTKENKESIFAVEARASSISD